MHNNDFTPASTVDPVERLCAPWNWSVVSDFPLVAELEAATHQVEDHATEEQKARIGALIKAYRQILGPLPDRLLPLAVQEVMGMPAKVALSLVPVAADAGHAADVVEEVAA